MVKKIILVLGLLVIISLLVFGCQEDVNPPEKYAKEYSEVLQEVDVILRKNSLFTSPHFKGVFHDGGYDERVKALNPEQPVPILIEQMIMATGDPFAVYFTAEEWKNYNLIREEAESLMVLSSPGVEFPGDRGLSSDGLPYVFPLMDGEMRQHPKIFYIKIKQFTPQAFLDLAYVLWDFRERGEEFGGLIIDLQGNPGGALSSAITSIDYFLPGEELIVTTRYADGSILHWKQNRFTFLDREKPLVILLDKDSASAAEIFAAALRDNKRAVIISRDERSTGKWSIGRLFPIKRGRYGALYISTGFWQTPINEVVGQGLKPDILVKWNEGDYIKNQKNHKYNPTIFKAIEYIEERLSNQAAFLFNHFKIRLKKTDD